MALKTKPEDFPAAVRFSFEEKGGSIEVTSSRVTQEDRLPYRLLGGSAQFPDIEAFKAKVIEAGMTPAVAEDRGRSFNATARQLRGLGFSVELPGNGA